MEKIVLAFVALVVCLLSDTTVRPISATTSLRLAASPPGNIITHAVVQRGEEGKRVPQQTRTLSFAERVAYQRAIEDVYWRHRIWPKENPEPKPSFDAVMTQAQLEGKVEDYLRKSQGVADDSQHPISAGQLQAEMDRMAQHTKQPEVLRELFEALGNDPFVIAECLAQPVLAARLVTNSHAYDQKVDGEINQGAAAALQANNDVEWMKQLSGKYSKIESAKSEKRKDRPTLVAVTPQKQPLGSWPATVEDQAPGMIAATSARYTLPNVSDGATCTDDTWTMTSITNAPTAGFLRTAVWTGSEMIVWGGADSTGGKYNPSTDSWTATTLTNAPSGRQFHTAVWTGSEMIVWGGTDGNNDLNTGGRYNPSTDSWIATTTSNAPSARIYHTAVWTGREMIVWGGSDFLGINNFNSGGKYNPGTDSWIATTTDDAPTGRQRHTAVWTGREMIVWGGFGGVNSGNTGGKYDPDTNSWIATSTTDAPTARLGHTAIWTGFEMIVWGGSDGTSGLGDGARYNPSTDSWTATPFTNAPSGRSNPTAVWTGSEMIVWGGTECSVCYTNTGGRYNPNTNSWADTSTTNAPTGRSHHTAVWTGNEMIVWGGYNDDPPDPNIGRKYCAQPPIVSAQLGNISTRAFVQTGDNVMIGGFIVQGSQLKRVIIRAIGPELAQYGVPNPLLNPTLELHDVTGALVASNDNWRATIIGGIITSNQVAEIRASGHAPSDGRESAIIADLPPGNYTAIVRGVNGSTGVVLPEVYDLDAQANSTLGNISTRAFVQTGDNVMIGGFIVQGSQAQKVILRAIGPELSRPPFNIPDALANPTLELHNSAGALIASNDDWRHTIIGGIITSDQRRDILRSGYAPTDPRESAIIAELPVGNYTAIVRGVNSTTGVGLVEVYDLH